MAREHTSAWVAPSRREGARGWLRQHELRDFAQRLPRRHDYLRHGSVWWRDAWWQLCCELVLERAPEVNFPAPQYTLEPVPGGTRLRVRMAYRVSTHFNWYARPIGWSLVRNFGGAALRFYAGQAEAANGRARAVDFAQ